MIEKVFHLLDAETSENQKHFPTILRKRRKGQNILQSGEGNCRGKLSRQSATCHMTVSRCALPPSRAQDTQTISQ